VRALLISTYDLGRQPFGLASPAAWLRRAGVDVDCADVSRDPIDDARITAADMVAFYLPMHTATRMAAPLIERVRSVKPSARICAYGLYAPLNAGWLQGRGVSQVLGPESEQELVAWALSTPNSQIPDPNPQPPNPNPQGKGLPRLDFIPPDRAGLPELHRYASLRMPDGTRRTMGGTDATRGCKHLCRHCPVVPVYGGQFRVVPLDVVLADIRAQVAAGAEHISFGDPDFLNGPTHARRVVEGLHGEFPELTYDVTIKIEHLLKHVDMLQVLRDTGCLFVTSAVESIDDAVLERLRKGHTRADFVRAVELCRSVGLTLTPTFIPFTPWTMLDGYAGLLNVLEDLDLVHEVAPIQLAIRLLVTADSPLLELPDIRDRVSAYDPASLTWPWIHSDARVDRLQSAVMEIVRNGAARSRSDVFADISAFARDAAGLAARPALVTRSRPVPYVSEPWYCCAEPMEIV
jgi:radical SAM superfamily enzyme YgiQ (UPF0313 family)